MNNKTLSSQQQMIARLAFSRFKSEKMQNSILIIAIIITTLLFTTFFTLISGIIEQMELSNMKQSGSSAHGIIKFLSIEQYEIIKQHPLIEEIGKDYIIGDISNDELSRQTTYLIGANKASIDMHFAVPIIGTYPTKENEILLDNESLDLLGIPLEIGSQIPLIFNIDGLEIQKDFVLCGYYERDNRLVVQGFYCSEAFANNFLLSNDNNIINAQIMFKNKKNIQQNLNTIITDSGFSTFEDSPDFLSSNENWAYIDISFRLNPTLMLAVLFIVLLIAATGYLIIYNISQISIINNTRSFGLLKAIGATKKQLKHILLYHILILSFIGIPVGLVLGYFTGIKLFPLILRETTMFSATMDITIDANPYIFTGSLLFSFTTILISINKPHQLAAKISPLEALKYNANPNITATSKSKKLKSPKLFLLRLSTANIIRNKKGFILTVLSLSLSLILFNSVVTITNSFDMDKYISKYINNDFILASNEYFQFSYTPSENYLSDDIPITLAQRPGFEQGEKIYCNAKDNTYYYIDSFGNDLDNTANEYGHYGCTIYGADVELLLNFPLLDGDLDIEKLNTGQYILEPILARDNGTSDLSTAQYAIGDKVKFYYYDASTSLYTFKEVEIIGHVQVNWFTETKRHYDNASFYTTSSGISYFFDNPALMSYSFNVTDNQLEATEYWLQNYTNEHNQNYESKELYKTNYSNLKLTVHGIGSLLSYIIGLIGIINFINFFSINIINRYKELAVLQSIGMTSKQLRLLLIVEGLYYIITAFIISIIAGAIFSLTFLRLFISQIWFLNYNFTLIPIVSFTAPLLIIGFLIPFLIATKINKQQLIKRLQAINY